jgi:uncharacterized DUF497 family protein
LIQGRTPRTLPSDGSPLIWSVISIGAQQSFIEDTRKDYGEKRFRVFGYIGDRLYVAVITPRNEIEHVISLRKANTREVKEYGNS